MDGEPGTTLTADELILRPWRPADAPEVSANRRIHLQKCHILAQSRVLLASVAAVAMIGALTDCLERGMPLRAVAAA